MRTDKDLLINLGKEDLWPTVYGYKSTDLKPVTSADITKGIPYAVWRAKTFKSLLTGVVKARVDYMAWAAVFANTYQLRTSDGSPLHFEPLLQNITASLESDLGHNHIVTSYFRRCCEGRVAVSKMDRQHKPQASEIAAIAGYSPTKSIADWFDRLKGAYPMLGLFAKSGADLVEFHPARHYDTLVSYIIDQDKLAGGSIPVPEA